MDQSNSEETQGLSVSQGRVQERRKGQSSRVRYAIRALQEIPVVLSAAVLVNYLSDLGSIDISLYEYPIFGFSIYILIRLYLSAKRLYVSSWSLVLYMTLITISILDFADNVFKLSDKFLYVQEIADALFITGVFSSLMTFIYIKFKSFKKNMHLH